jgi:hypothetical protein
MKFKFVQTSLLLADYLSDTGEIINNRVVDILNEYFKGWVWIYNPDIDITNTIYYVSRYYIETGSIWAKTFQNSFPDPVEEKDIIIGKDITIRGGNEGETDLFYKDIIYKIESVKLVDEKPNKVRWWKGGKFENLKTFEQFNEAVRWYNKGKLENPVEFDFQETEYNDFITDDEFRKFLIDNDVYDEYIKNTLDIKFKQTMVDRNFAANFAEKKSDKYISSAFDWYLSPEGHYFWSNLNKKWIND